jgi:hypothetical protein
MSVGAILMMLLAIAIIWGGLAAAILNLNRNPPSPDEDL